MSRCPVAGRKGVRAGVWGCRSPPTAQAGPLLPCTLSLPGPAPISPIFGVRMMSIFWELALAHKMRGGLPNPQQCLHYGAPALEELLHRLGHSTYTRLKKNSSIHPSILHSFTHSFKNVNCSSWGRATYSGAVQRFLTLFFCPASGPLLLTTVPQFPFEDSLSPAKMPRPLLPCNQRVIL